MGCMLAQMDDEILEIDVQRGCKMYFDGAANQKGYGIGIVLVAPYDAYFPIAVKFHFPATKKRTWQNLKHASEEWKLCLPWE